jgi:hypothetical protein
MNSLAALKSGKESGLEIRHGKVFFTVAASHCLFRPSLFSGKMLIRPEMAERFEGQRTIFLNNTKPMIRRCQEQRFAVVDLSLAKDPSGKDLARGSFGAVSGAFYSLPHSCSVSTATPLAEPRALHQVWIASFSGHQE